MTLMIIGVIASMTIPTLKKNTQSTEYAAKLKKTYSVLAQATELVEANYAPIPFWDSSAKNEYKKYLSIIRECPPAKDCFYNGNIKYRGGGKDVNYGDSGWVLADGVSVKPAGLGRALSTASTEYGLDPGEKFKGGFYIDINGISPPNQWGADVFLLLIVPEKGLVPSGAYLESSCINAYGCAAKVIAEGKAVF